MIEALELREHVRRELPKTALLESDGALLWDRHRTLVETVFPSPRTKQHWRLKSRGWVGYLPVSETLEIRLSPKVDLQNIFRMLEVAHDLRSLEILPGLADCDSLVDFYERLANILAERTLDRGRRGFHRSYVGREERLESVRGRIDLGRAAAAPWQVRLDCQFEENTPDVENNQILLWTLDRIARNAACQRPDVLRNVRRARDHLLGGVTLRSFEPEACHGRTYTHLDEDYRPLHALCRFFLEHSGPAHWSGRHRNLPFLVNMEHLFEVYVARWLRDHLPGHLRLQTQNRTRLGPNGELVLKIDIVLSTREGRTLAVLDTKYTQPKKLRPSNREIYQVVTYATAKGCRDAVLLYPVRIEDPLDLQVGEVRVRGLGFDLGGDLEADGNEVLGQILVE